MDKRLKFSKKQIDQPSKPLACLGLVIALLLPYFLVNHFSHHKKSEATRQLSLPLIKQEKGELKAPLAKQSEHLIPTVAIKKDPEWQVVKPKSGDSLAIIFNRLGLSAKNLHEILQKNPHAKMLTTIKPDQKLRFLIHQRTLEKLIIPFNRMKTLTVCKEGRAYKTRLLSKKMSPQNLYITGVVKGSLYGTAKRLNIPYTLINQMTSILSKEIDFSRSIRAGDRFSILYSGYTIKNKVISTGDILALTYTNQKKVYQAIKHTDANGHSDYYTPQGDSLKKAFSRYPIRFSHISSTFELARYHPILHYKRAHKGIDLAAPIGTPIQATGDGTIEIINRHNGYGNMIRIRHDQKYSTIYGHLLRFQKGLSRGSKVKRGQVIGYVGQTGLATGPHCHYELRVNNQPKNPTTTPLPTAPSVPAKEMGKFKAESRTLLAQLKSHQDTMLASAQKRNAHVG